MNAHWVKWVSVLTLAVAGALAACSSDDDDDDNNSKAGSGGRAGAGQSGNGNQSGNGSSGNGSSGNGSSGSAGAGGGGNTPPLPPTEVAALKTALDAGNYLPDIKAEKWNCEDGEVEGANLGETEIEAHGGAKNDPVPTRVCANFSLAGQDYKAEADGGNAAGWPLGAASVKETYDDQGNVIAIAYYALKADATWFVATATPDGDPQPPGAGRTFTVEEGTGCANCHKGADFVVEGNLVPRSAQLAAPNPYKVPLP
jgi:hypothetical protein